MLILKLQDNADQILMQISEFLAEGRLKVYERDPRFTCMTDGFDSQWVTLQRATHRRVWHYTPLGMSAHGAQQGDKADATRLRDYWVASVVSLLKEDLQEFSPEH